VKCKHDGKLNVVVQLELELPLDNEKKGERVIAGKVWASFNQNFV
jgi:hypothetical protein